MSVDAIAVLPKVASLGRAVAGEWRDGEGPGGVRRAFLSLRDATLVNLAVHFDAPDADLYEAARQWLGRAPPARIWVYPDVAEPEGATAKAIRDATAPGGRWVKAGPKEKKGAMPWLEGLGLTREDIQAFQRDALSGDPTRAAAAIATFEKKLAAKDPAALEAALAAFLKRG